MAFLFTFADCVPLCVSDVPLLPVDHGDDDVPSSNDLEVPGYANSRL